MKSRNSRRNARASRQTKKAANLGPSLAKTASDARKSGVSSGVAVAHRGPVTAAAMALPAPANAPELRRMGSEKALAACSAGTHIFSGLMAAQLAWMKFGFAQARLGGIVFEGFLQAKATPLTAGRVVAETTERA